MERYGLPSGESMYPQNTYREWMLPNTAETPEGLRGKIFDIRFGELVKEGMIPKGVIDAVVIEIKGEAPVVLKTIEAPKWTPEQLNLLKLAIGTLPPGGI